jgi:protein involved in sex pheromone biosynthesis
LSFAVLSFDMHNALNVESWHDIAEEAVTAANLAAANNASDDTVVYRAAKSGWDGYWRSLTDAPLHHPSAL